MFYRARTGSVNGSRITHFQDFNGRPKCNHHFILNFTPRQLFSGWEGGGKRDSPGPGPSLPLRVFNERGSSNCKTLILFYSWKGFDLQVCGLALGLLAKDVTHMMLSLAETGQVEQYVWSRNLFLSNFSST